MHSRTSEFPSHWGFAQDFRTKKKKKQWIQKMKQQDVRNGVETAYTTKRKSNGSQTEKPAATAKRKKHGVQFFSVLPTPTALSSASEEMMASAPAASSPKKMSATQKEQVEDFLHRHRVLKRRYMDITDKIVCECQSVVRQHMHLELSHWQVWRSIRKIKPGCRPRVRRKVIDDWDTGRTQVFMKVVDQLDQLNLNENDTAETIWYVLDHLATGNRPVMRSVRVLYLRNLKHFDYDCMEALTRVLERYPNIFSLNMGEYAAGNVLSGIPAAWELLADRIPRTNLGFLWADEAAGCSVEMVARLQQICKDRRHRLEMFHSLHDVDIVEKLAPWRSERIVEKLRINAPDPRCCKRARSDNKLSRYYAFGMVRLKKCHGLKKWVNKDGEFLPDEYNAWLRGGHGERLLGPMVDGRQVRAIKRADDWAGGGAYCRCHPGAKCRCK